MLRRSEHGERLHCLWGGTSDAWCHAWPGVEAPWPPWGTHQDAGDAHFTRWVAPRPQEDSVSAGRDIPSYGRRRAEEMQLPWARPLLRAGVEGQQKAYHQQTAPRTKRARFPGSGSLAIFQDATALDLQPQPHPNNSVVCHYVRREANVTILAIPAWQRLCQVFVSRHHATTFLDPAKLQLLKRKKRRIIQTIYCQALK